MTRTICAALFLVLSAAARAGGVDCPPESIPNQADPVSGPEAWCELASDRTLLHGPYRSWHPNGVLGTEEHYVRGKANGFARYRWGSGEKQAEGRFKDGAPDGWWSFWDKTGNKAGRVRYRDGALVAGRLPRWALDWDGAPVAKRPPPTDDAR